MAAISLSNWTRRVSTPGEGNYTEMFTSPNTADSGDTLDVSGVFIQVQMAWAWDQETGDAVTITESAGNLTIDASGGTTDKTYNVLVLGTKAQE